MIARGRMHTALIGIGSNLGDRSRQLAWAVEQLAARPGVTVRRTSRWRETQAVGGPQGQDVFLNGAILLETSLRPEALLGVLLQIEDSAGRVRSKHWGPRPLDLDLLLFDDVVLNTERLVLPHPRLAFRRFALEPAAELAPDWMHPTLGWTLAALLTHLDRELPYVAIGGPLASGKTWLARQLAAAVSGRLISQPAAVLHAAGWFCGEPLEYLSHCTVLLEPLCQCDASWSVSDFWFDQLQLDIGQRLVGPARESFRDAWSQARDFLVRPKLTILLDAPTELLFARWLQKEAPGGIVNAERASAIQAEIDRQRSGLAQYAATLGLGPLLRIDSSDERLLLAEAQAALEAMR